jgi:hypothetical protein
MKCFQMISYDHMKKTPMFQGYSVSIIGAWSQSLKMETESMLEAFLGDQLLQNAIKKL